MNDADKKILKIIENTGLYTQAELDAFVKKFEAASDSDFLTFLLDSHLLTKPQETPVFEDDVADQEVNLLDDDDDFIPAQNQQTLMNFARTTPNPELSKGTTQVQKKDESVDEKKSGKSDSSFRVSDYLKDEYQIESSVNLQAPESNATMLDLGAKKKAKKDKSKDTDALGKHHVTGEIGRGGMGAVLAVFDNDLQRELAAKVILTGSEASKFELEKFLIEAQITGQLEHPNIVPVHEINVSNDRRIFFTMKYVRGKSLQGILHAESAYLKRKNLNPRLKYWDLGKFPDVMTLNEKLDIFVKICDAISFAHSKGVIHRDLKPANVMVGEFGEVQVMDWGLAKVLGRKDAVEDAVKLDLNKGDVITNVRNGDDSAPLVTVDGRIVGTPAYMPPEQANGDIHLIDERSDIYAIGVILYEMLTYQLPFEGASAWEIVAMVTSQNPLTPSQQAEKVGLPTPPRELEAIVMKAMNKKRENRYKSVKELRTEISRFLEGHTVGAAEYSSWQLITKWVKRNKGFVTSAVIVFAIAIVLAVISFVNISDALKSETNQRKIAENEKERAETEWVRAEKEKQNAQIQERKALESEAETAKALKRSQENLCLAYAKAAESALNEGNIPAAMLFAGNWLSIREDKEARNICLNYMNQPMRILHQLRHKGRLKQAQYNSDSSILLTVADDVYLWDADGDLLCRIHHDDNEIAFARFSPDESLVLTASWYVKGKCWGKEIKVWDLEGNLLATLVHESFIGMINFSANGKMLLTSTFEYNADDGQLTKGKDGIKVWDFEGENLRTIPVENEVIDASFNFDAKYILFTTLTKSGTQDLYVSTVSVFNLDSAEIKPVSQNGFVYFARFAGSSNQICLNLYEYTLTKSFLKFFTPEGVEEFSLEVNSENLRIDFSRGNEFFITNNVKPRFCTLFNVEGKKIAEFEHDSRILNCELIDSDRKILVETLQNIYLWDIESKQKAVIQVRGNISNYVRTRDSSRIAVASQDMLTLWDLQGNLIYSIKMPENILEIAFSNDNQEIVVLSGSIAYIWDLSADLDDVLMHKNEINSVRIIGSENLVVTSSAKTEEVFVWDFDGDLIFKKTSNKGLFNVFEKQERICTAEGNEIVLTDFVGSDASRIRFQTKITDIRASANAGFILVLVEGEENYQLINIARDSMKEVQSLQTAYSPRFSETGKLYAVFVTQDTKMYLAVHNLNGREISRIDVSNLMLKDVIFTSDDRNLIAFDYSGHLICKEISGAGSFNIEHTEGINFVSVSADAKYILVSSFGSSKIYDLKGSNHATIEHEGELTFAQFGPESHRILIAGKKITLWNIKGEKLADLENPNAHNFVINAKFVDSETIFVGTNNAMTLWNVDGTIIYNILLKKSVRYADYNQDSKVFVSADANKVRLWKIKVNSENVLLRQRYKTGFTLRGMNISPEQTYLLSSQLIEFVDKRANEYANYAKLHEIEFYQLKQGHVSDLIFSKFADSVVTASNPAEIFAYLLSKYESFGRNTALKMFLSEAVIKKVNSMQFKTQTAENPAKYELLLLTIAYCQAEGTLDIAETTKIDEHIQAMREVRVKAEKFLQNYGTNELIEIITQN